MEVILAWEDEAGQTRQHGARVSDAMSQGDLVDLGALAAACSVAGLQTGARLDTSLDLGDLAGPGPYPSVSQRIRLTFDGLGHADVEWDVLAPSADCFNLDGSPAILADPLLSLIEWLLIALRTEDDTLVGGVKSAVLVEGSAADALVLAATRLPAGERPCVDYWTELGADVTTRGNGD